VSPRAGCRGTSTPWFGYAHHRWRYIVETGLAEGELREQSGAYAIRPYTIGASRLRRKTATAPEASTARAFRRE